MDEAHLIRVHETGIAHHVAAVGQVDGEHRAAAVLDGAAAVVVQLFVVVGADVAAGKHLLQMPEELRIDGDDIFEMSVHGTFLDHQDLAVALDDLRLDFAGLFLQQDAVILFAVDDLLADFRHAARAQRIGFARPAQGRLRFFAGLQQRLVRPLRREGWILGNEVVAQTENPPRAVGSNRHRFFKVFNGLMHLP